MIYVQDSSILDQKCFLVQSRSMPGRRDGVDWNAVLPDRQRPQPAQALDQTIQEADEAQSVALQATPAELYHRDHH
jgi:hypothetical protein